MEQNNDRKPDTTALIAQLQQLNERTRWYSSRSWQESLSFFGIVALAVSFFHEQGNLLRGLILVGLGTLGCVLFVSIGSMQRAKRAAVEALARIEIQLGLEHVTQERRGISPPLRALVLVASLAFLVCAIALTTAGVKATLCPAQPCGSTSGPETPAIPKTERQ